MKNFKCELHKEHFPKETSERPIITKHEHHRNGNHSDNRPENIAFACARCHNLEHGITPQINEIRKLYELYKDIQFMRIKLENNVRACKIIEMEVPGELDELKEFMIKEEKKIIKKMKGWLKTCEIYNAWLKHIKGIGEVTSAGLLALIGNIKLFPKISNLWSYSGYGLKDNKVQKRKRGQGINYNPRFKALMHVVADGFVKNHNKDDCYYGKLYEKFRAVCDKMKVKAEDYKNDPYYKKKKGLVLIKKGHAYNRALRKVKKVFLKDLWLVWRDIEKLPITKPYENEHLKNHVLHNPPKWRDLWR